MALFFNLNVLETQAQGSLAKFMALLEYHYRGNLPTKKSKFKPSKVSLRGGSFILNPAPLFSTTTDISFVVQYIKLAARRDYFMYQTHNLKTLNLSFFPDLNLEAIRFNPLLKVVNNEIHFKYEE